MRWILISDSLEPLTVAPILHIIHHPTATREGKKGREGGREGGNEEKEREGGGRKGGREGGRVGGREREGDSVGRVLLCPIKDVNAQRANVQCFEI